MRILVAGGSGFIGSHLVDRLLDDGRDVLAVDNFATGNASKLAHLADNPRFELLVHDVCEPFDAEVDAIYNFASPASPVTYQRDPVQTMKTNVLGSITLLELARRRGIPILQSSTSEVYGDPEVHPQHEGYWGNVNPIGPRSCYDEGKRAAETLFFDYHRQYGVDIRVARIFNTYGPRMERDDGRVIPVFIGQALRGEPITIFGDGSQTRSFCYVSDLVDGVVKFMDSDSGFTGPLNLGNPTELTMVQLAEFIIELTNSSSELIHEPLPVDDPRQRRPDITLATTTLDWTPAIDLRAGLQRTINALGSEPTAW